jgi:hypothetical protein
MCLHRELGLGFRSSHNPFTRAFHNTHTCDQYFNAMTSLSSPEVVYALDFDGVLVDSATETAQSGWRGCRVLFSGEEWTNNDEQLPSIIERFVQVRPILYVGWESIVICQLLGDPALGSPSVDDILNHFHDDDDRGLKARAMKHSGLQDEDYHRVFKDVRDKWIDENNGQDWILAHAFFEGACQAVRDFLKETKQSTNNFYVITTKAKEFALRLLEQEKLYCASNPTDPNKIQESHVFGLGSGSKASVLQKILNEHDENWRLALQKNDDGHSTSNAPTTHSIAIMVEDNIATLQKIIASPIGDRVVPVVASWGYNTQDQLEVARKSGYIMLSKDDSGSLRTVLDDNSVITSYSKLSLVDA